VVADVVHWLQLQLHLFPVIGAMPIHVSQAILMVQAAQRRSNASLAQIAQRCVQTCALMLRDVQRFDLLALKPSVRLAPASDACNVELSAKPSSPKLSWMPMDARDRSVAVQGHRALHRPAEYTPGAHGAEAPRAPAPHGAVQRTAQMMQADALAQRFATLSAREREVLALMAHGKINKQISWELGVTEQTIKFHRRRMKDKMGAASNAALMYIAGQLGIAGHQAS
jgi:DNA-binding CsgD family transcriptional regulator